MSNFYDTKENEDLKMLKEWNDQVKAFETITPNPKGAQIDVTAQDRKGNYYSIELKQRETSFSGFTFDDVYIEPSKVAALSEKKNKYNHKILYINFFSDGNEVVVWDFTRKITNINYHPSVPIYDKGCKCKKKEDRLGLPLNQVKYWGKIDDVFKQLKSPF